jgi:hypothetical protein
MCPVQTVTYVSGRSMAPFLDPTSHLRKRLRRHDPSYGNGGSAYCTTIPLAKSLCGTTGGLYPSRMPGPRDRVK